MLRLRHKLLIQVYQILDQLILIGVLAAVFWMRPDKGVVSDVDTEQISRANFQFIDTIAILLLLGGWVMIYRRCISYSGNRFSSRQTEIRGVFNASVVSAFWLFLISFSFGVESITPLSIIIFWGCAVILGCLARELMRFLFMRARQSGLSYRYLVIVGASEESWKLAEKIQSRDMLGYKIVGVIAEDEEEKENFEKEFGSKLPVIGVIDEMHHILVKQEVDEMMVCLSVEAKFKNVAKAFRSAKELGIVLRVIPTASEAGMLKELKIENFEGRNLITFFRQQHLFQLLVKRLMDIVLSGFGLIAISPILILAALKIKSHDGGPIFFSQTRVGRNNRRFEMLKFRSMVVNAEELKASLADQNERKDGPAFKIKNDPRITPIGHFLRRTSIDELPQLINVFKGEMSLVGPRPPLPNEVDGYEWKFRRRLSVPQGITCLWQIGGRDDIDFGEWMNLDQRYIDNWSVWLDLKILTLTIPAVLLGRGAN